MYFSAVVNETANLSEEDRTTLQTRKEILAITAAVKAFISFLHILRPKKLFSSA